MNPFKPRQCTSKHFQAILQEQRDHVDRELLIQGLLEAHSRDVGNLDCFIAPEIKNAIKLDVDNPEFLWEFCSELTYAIQNGYTISDRKKKYIGLQYNSLFTCLKFVPKSKRSTVLQVSDWVNQINFSEI